jgi:aconitate hydratase
MVDEFGTPKAFEQNVALEYERNIERYQFLKWGASAFDNFQVVPPGTGICHQVNLENIARQCGAPPIRRAKRSPIPTLWSERTATRRW